MSKLQVCLDNKPDITNRTGFDFDPFPYASKFSRHWHRTTYLIIRVMFSVFPITAFYWLTVWCLTPFSTVFQLYHGSQCTYPCFSGVSSTRHNILSMPLAAFPLNHCRNNGQWWQRNESCCNDLSSILRKYNGRARDQPTTPYLGLG